MRIVYIVPSSGGSFYCGNCIRDLNLISGLRELGQDITVIPMYLPLLFDESETPADTSVFFGAVGLYLRQKFHFLRRAPGWVNRMLDSPLLLNLAAGLAGSTRASGLGEMTLSMLRGEQGGQVDELEELVATLRETVKPDVVHLSNALLLGTARRIKQETSAAIVCSLQDEDSWIEALESDQALEVRRLLSEASADVDILLPVSRYYAEFFQKYTLLQAKHMQVVPIGVDLRGYEQAAQSPHPPAVGFLSRMCEESGLELLVDAVLEVKKDNAMRELRLLVSGGSTGDDKLFLRHLRAKIRKRGIEGDVRFFQKFGRSERQRFFQGLSLFSVPSLRATAFGLYLLEALSSGVPVIQPNIGAFPEIINTTGGGVLYQPNDAPTLASALKSLLLDKEKTAALGLRGRAAVQKKYALDTITKKMVKVYEKSLDLR
jgi:glycosyltransferase involved in cell wall biosynthesis